LKPFHFKQFSVQQEKSAMKIGTDAVLLGAWAPLHHPFSILDIGAGTGIIALILAQRSGSQQIDALEIDEDAYEECVENFENAADARAKRDGKFLEKIGTYNPNTNPAIIDLNVDQAVQWLHNGAQPTDTARAILSYKGALLKHHLDGGVRKGALTQEQADAKFAAWLDAKAGKVDAKKDGLSKAKADAKAVALKAEKEANDKRAKAIAEAAKAAEESAVVEETTEEAVADVEETTPAVEENNEETQA